MKYLSLFTTMVLCLLLLAPQAVRADTDMFRKPSGKQLRAEEAVTLACDFIRELTGTELTDLYSIEDGMKVKGRPEMYFGPGWQWEADTTEDCWVLILRNRSTIDPPMVVLHGETGEVLYWEYTDQALNCTYLNSLPTGEHLSCGEAVAIAKYRLSHATDDPISGDAVRFTGAAFGDADTWVAETANAEAEPAWKIELSYEAPEGLSEYIVYIDAKSGEILREWGGGRP